METQEHMKKEEEGQEQGHHVESMFLEKHGLTVYVPSPEELRSESDIVQPFCGEILNGKFEFWCALDVGTALMRLIESFGLPNAPEYHEWTDGFMKFGRESCFWAYIFRINKTLYLYVSHDDGKINIGYTGCKGTPDKAACQAFFHFIENVLNRTEDR